MVGSFACEDLSCIRVRQTRQTPPCDPLSSHDMGRIVSFPVSSMEFVLSRDDEHRGKDIGKDTNLPLQ